MSTTLDALRLVLVSSNRLCRQILAAAGFTCRAVTSTMDEAMGSSSPVLPSHRAESLAYFRARAVADQQPDACVLATCTVVAVDGEIIGAPVGRLEAERMLRRLSGTRHDVITSLALLQPGQRRLIASDVTHVQLAEMSDADIAEHLDSGEWLGIAGAYGTPDMAERFVQDVDGSFSNLLGLPVELLDRMLTEMREHPDAHRHA